MVYDGLKFYKRGFKILTNIKSLVYGEYITSNDILTLSRQSKLRDCVLLIDEIELFFDSRNFSNSVNKDFSGFLQQIRKRNIHILCTCQYISLVDIRIRQQTDLIIRPEIDKYTLFCKVYYFDITQLEDDDKSISPTFLVYNAKPIFQLYDTFEMIE